MQTMKAKSFSNTLIGFIFIVFPFLYWKDLPDPCFNLRVLFLAIAGLLTTSFLFLNPRLSGAIQPDRSLKTIGVLTFSFLFLSLISCLLHINAGDAFTQWLLIANTCTLVLVLAVLREITSDFQRRLTLYAALSALLYIGFFFIDVFPELLGSLSNGNWPVIRYEDGGTAGNKNFLAEVLVLNLFFILPGLSKRRSPVNSIQWSAVVLSFFSLFILKSNGAILALLIGLSYYIFASNFPVQRYGKFIRLAGLPLTIIAMMLLMGKSISDKVLPLQNSVWDPVDIRATEKSNNNSVYERKLMWRNSMQLIQEHPLLGVGLNNWKIQQAKFGIGGNPYLNTGMERFEQPHNEFISILSELGIIGMLLLMSIVRYLIKNRDRHIEAPLVLISTFAGLLAFAALCLFSYPLHREVTLTLFAVHLSALIMFRKSESSNSFQWSSKWIFISGLFLLTAFIFYLRLRCEYHLGQGMAAQLRKQHDRAKKEYGLSNSLFYSMDENGTPLEWYEGNACFRKGKSGEAVEILERGRARNPYHVRLLNDLGTAYEQTGRHDSAISCYKTALVFCPGLIETRLNLAASCYNAGKLEGAYGALAGLDRTYKLKGRDKDNFLQFRSVILNELISSDTLIKENFMNSFDNGNAVKYEQHVVHCFEENESPDGFIQCMRKEN
jgi:O-antigen ligase